MGARGIITLILIVFVGLAFGTRQKCYQNKDCDKMCPLTDGGVCFTIHGWNRDCICYYYPGFSSEYPKSYDTFKIKNEITQECVTIGTKERIYQAECDDEFAGNFKLKAKEGFHQYNIIDNENDKCLTSMGLDQVVELRPCTSQLARNQTFYVYNYKGEYTIRIEGAKLCLTHLDAYPRTSPCAGDKVEIAVFQRWLISPKKNLFNYLFKP